MSEKVAAFVLFGKRDDFPFSSNFPLFFKIEERTSN